MKRIFFQCLVLILILPGWVYSQPLYKQSRNWQGVPFKVNEGTETLLSSAQFQTDLLPKSPEAEAMLKYTAMPVTLYSGLPQVSIPIYEIKTRSLDIPVSLSYNYNGYKPAEVASSVGLGWNVQGGGVISRMIKSKVDHIDASVNNADNNYDAYANMNLISGKQAILQQIGLGTLDGEPDQYVFNAPGLSGKFILMQGKAFLFPKQDIQVQQHGDEEGFTITNEKGDRYFFLNQEYSHHKQTTQFAENIPNHVSSWFLTRIISADMADTINYDYTPYTFKQPPNYSQTLTTTMKDGSVPTAMNVQSQTLTESTTSGDSISSLLLSSISWKQKEIDFILDTAARKDQFILNGVMHAISRILVLADGASSGKTFVLYHDYLNGKLNLTKVAALPLIDAYDTTTVNSAAQWYKFEYENTAQAANISGWDNRSIDHWGYYNGAINPTLFAESDIAYTLYGVGNRNPSFSNCVTNTLNKITYPTGGYTTFTYGLNQTGHYIVYPNYTTDTINKVLYYSDASITASNGSKTISGTFDINVAQNIFVHYGSYDDFNLPAHALLTIKRGNLTVYTSPSYTLDFPGGSDSIYLTTGSYTYSLVCDNNIVGVEGRVVYKNYPVSNTLADGPGVRVEQIASYDNVHAAPASVKKYAYNEGAGIFTAEVRPSTVIRYGSMCSPGSGGCSGDGFHDIYINTLQSGFYSSLNDLINNPFYYKNVEETTISTDSIGKTAYVYNCFAPVDPEVFLQQKTDYAYAGGGQYYAVNKSVSNYTDTTDRGFQTFTASVTSQVYNGGSCYLCPLVPTPDYTQPVDGLINLFTATHNILESGYKRLRSTFDTAWDMHGQNPMVTATYYYYDNTSHLMPTRTVSTNSKGETVTTQMKYAMDYPVSSGMTPGRLDSLSKVEMDSIALIYDICYDNLLSDLGPYQPYSTHVTAFTNIANSYHCETDYKSNSQAVFDHRDSQWDAYLAGLDSAQSADPVAWHKAVFWMQSNHIINPLIEKYVTVKKADGNEYLLSAMRNVYSLVPMRSGLVAAMQTGIQMTEQTGPVLKSTFLSNPDALYKDEGYITYNTSLDITSKTKIHDVSNHYLWGYGHQYPVAEIVGSDQATIEGFVDQSKLQDVYTDANEMRTELNKVRTGLAGTKAMVTTATYDPMSGMTSKTDAGGHTTYFEYDEFQRLKRIRDQDSNIVKQYDYQYQASSGCGPNCYAIAMQTFAGTATLGYPVGVFDVHGKLLGKVTGASQYVTLWNSDTADARIGTLSTGNDSLHFNMTLNTGMTLPAGVTGCRYYQVDLAWSYLDGVRNFNGAYVDFGDNTGMRLGAGLADTPAVIAANTIYAAVYEGYLNQTRLMIYYMHTYPDTSLKTLTFYHNDANEMADFDNIFGGAISLTYLKNLRGNFPLNMPEIGGSCYQQASMTSLASILNWSSLHHVTNFRLNNGDLLHPCWHISYPQDFMAGNPGLSGIYTTWRPNATGYYDTTFRLSRLKSDWNTYFTQLSYIRIHDDHWNHEDLTALTKLNAFFLFAYTQDHLETSNSLWVTIPTSRIDSIINQIAAGAGQTVTGGTITIYSAGPDRSSASDTAVSFLTSKGWTITINTDTHPHF